MNNPSNPIGKTAAASLIQTAPAKGNVITTLASAILSNYGKILLLVGAVCLIRYVVTHLKGPAQQDIEPPSDLPEDERQEVTEITTPLTSPAQQDIEPSSELPEDERQEAREIICQVARHKDVLALLEQKIPGLRDEIHKNLTSSTMNDVRGCLVLLQGPKDINVIAAIKLGENPWILSKGNKQDHNIRLIIDKSKPHYFMSVNNQITRTLLTQAGVTDEELEQCPDNDWLTLSINNHQLTEVKGYKSKTLPLSIEFICAPKMLPAI